MGEIPHGRIWPDIAVYGRIGVYIGGLPSASALSFSHVDVGDAFQFINHISHGGDINTRSEWLFFSHIDVGDAFQFINHISAVCLPPVLCLFHT